MAEDTMVPQLRFKGFTGDWEQSKLGDMAEIVGGGTPSTTNAEYWDGEIDWYAPAEIADQIYVNSSQRKITKEGYENSSAKMLPVGTVLFTSRAGIGKTAILLKESCTNQGFQSIVPHKDELDSYFIFSRTEELKKFGETVGAGSTFVEVSGKQMAQMLLMMPTALAEQQRIGAFFANLDHLIALHQRKYDKLLALKKSMLEKMFPKAGSDVPEIRFAGFTEAWKEYKLSEIAMMHARIGWQNLRKSEFLDSGNYYLITGTDFVDGRVDLAHCHFVARDRYDQDPNIQISDGSILITKDGTLGKVAYVKGLDRPATLNAGVFNVVIRDKEQTDGKYLFQYLKAPFLMDYVGQKATGGTIKHLNQNILVDFPVIIPQIEEQERIGQYFDDLDNLIACHQRRAEKLKQIKQSMLEKMFA